MSALPSQRWSEPPDPPSAAAIADRAEQVYAHFARDPNKRPAALKWHIDACDCYELATVDPKDACEIGAMVNRWIENGLRGMAEDYALADLVDSHNPERIPYREGWK